jgi:hypothetical protein
MKPKTTTLSVLTAFLILVLSIPISSVCQSWDSYDIGESGCSAYFPYQPEWDFSYSDDSSYVWVGEVTDSEITYGVICIEFNVPFYDATEEELIEALETYLDFLRGQFKIVSHTGYDTGYWDEDNIDATGIGDSWTDNVGDPWLIEAWIDPYNLAVLYIYGSPDKPITENKDYFFNSFSFPEY